MARKGIFRRIGDAVQRTIDRFLPPPQPPQRPTPPPPPVPPGEPGSGGRGGGRYRGPFWDTWQYTVTERDIADITERTGYSENEEFQVHFEILYSLDPEADSDTLEEMWQDYLLAFVSDGMTHDAFFEMWSIDPRDFDWQAWRDAMGYSHRK